MVKSANKSGDGSGSVGSVAPFLRKCYEMVDDGATDSIISWSETNDCFVIWDMTQFSVLLLPKYFKHSNFSSFMRQLNIYGFRKIDPDRWVFANEGFIRGQKHLLENIYRRKHPHGSDQRKTLQQKDTPDGPCEKIENVLWREVENLKTDKNALKQELVKLRQHQETSENKLLLLRDQLCGMEKNQQQMLSFLVMAMQSPGFLLQLLQPKENSWRMAEAGKVLEQGADDCELVVSDGAIVRYQPPMDETPKPILTPNSGSEKEPEHDSHLDGTKDFFVNPDFMKMLMDEKSCSLENHSPFILPDITDDGAWERLLLASPFLENIEGAMEDGKEPVDSGKAEHHHSLHELIGQDEDPESTASELDESHDFYSLMEEMEKSQNFAMESTIFGSDTGNSRNLELITEQMGLLVSDPNDKHRTQRGK